jgi:hypothetical protein
VYVAPLAALIMALSLLYVIKKRSKKPGSLVVSCPNHT